MSIQPIYIYIIENIVPFDNKKSYLINEDLSKSKEYHKLYYSLNIPNSTVYIRINLINNSNIKRRTPRIRLPNEYLDSLRLITFNEMLDLLKDVGKRIDKSWDLSEVISLLQLIIANWEDWY